MGADKNSTGYSSNNNTSTPLLLLAAKLKDSGYFKYNAGNDDLLNKILTVSNEEKPQEFHENMVRRIIQQPTALYCNGEDNTISNGACCFAHIVENQPPQHWEQACKDLDEHLQTGLKSEPAKEDMSPEKVLAWIEAEGKRLNPSQEWNDAFEWLQLALLYICDGTKPPPKNYQDLAENVKQAAATFEEAEGFPLRPCQLAAILLNVYGVMSGAKHLIEMKTGEGKTYVCGVSAMVVAKMFHDGPAVILTSSVDRANDDKKSTKKFIKEYLGYDPITVEELKPGKKEFGAGRVAYGQVSDVQHIVVDMLKENNPKGLYDFLETCSFFLDEADHVLVEQAESLLYIASPCPCYYALHGLFFQIQYRIDYEGEFKPEKVKTRMAIQEKAKKLTETIIQHISDFQYEQKKKGNSNPLFPTIIDIDAFVAACASGAMSARFKENGKQYVIEITSESDHHGTIPGVEKITIVDVATGTESDGTRWTTEAPFIEAMEGLPIGGSDPLAYYSAFPYLLEKVRWFGGITGTVGAAHTLNYYDSTFDVRSTFRIPRNKLNTTYQLPTIVTEDEKKQLERIIESISSWIKEEKEGIPAKGPVLVIAESIQKAQKIENNLKERGHVVMEAKDQGGDDDDDDENDDKEKVSWVFKAGSSPSSDSVCSHLFPFYSRKHVVMEKFPTVPLLWHPTKAGEGWT
eukprot:gb/GECH01004454.1/.p1 GENE.gb/GECH01004454.1/~~gb/GECH01004454.1/.p1  ORF type:complete len:688 (+),score=62.41 gb/GECH01004454.1/:1-2064(+)